jgi:hypothetical protein
MHKSICSCGFIGMWNFVWHTNRMESNQVGLSLNHQDATVRSSPPLDPTYALGQGADQWELYAKQMGKPLEHLSESDKIR